MHKIHRNVVKVPLSTSEIAFARFSLTVLLRLRLFVAFFNLVRGIFIRFFFTFEQKYQTIRLKNNKNDFTAKINQ